MVRGRAFGHIRLLMATAAVLGLVDPTFSAAAQSCEFAPAFAPLAAVLPVPFGDCVSPEAPEGGLVRQAFTLGDFVQRTTDGATAFASGGTVWTIQGTEVREGPLDEWLAMASPVPLSSAAAESQLGLPGIEPAVDPLLVAARSVHRIRVGGELGTAVSTTVGILTSAHLVANVDNVELVTSEGELVIANVARLDEILDVALLEAPISLPLIELPQGARVLLDQQAVVIGHHADLPDGGGSGRTLVTIRGRTRQRSGIQTIDIDGQLGASESGGAMLDLEGRFLGLFAYGRREPGELHAAVSVESLADFAQSTASRTLVPRSPAATIRTPEVPTRTPTPRQPATPTRAPSPMAPPTRQPATPTRQPAPIVRAPTATASDPNVIRREFFDSTATTLRLGVTGDYEFSVYDREYKIFRKAARGKYTLGINTVPLTSTNESDIAIQLTARLVGAVEGRTIIVACRHTDSGSQYRVTISPEFRSFIIEKWIQNQLHAQPVPWRNDSAIESNPRDKNNIEFSCIGSEFKLTINGKQVASFTDIELREGSAWFTASPWKEVVGDTDARFSNILVTRGQ